MHWLFEKVYASGDEFFTELLKAVEQAQRTIDISVYIYEADTWGQRLTDALVAACRRGVAVRVVVDGVGSPDFQSRFAPILEAAGGLWHYYHPLPWQRFQAIPRRNGFWNRVSSYWGKINRRNHSKFFLFDSERLFSGSLNVAQKHSERLTGDASWRDIGIETRGEGVRELEEAFLWMWDRRWPDDPYDHPLVFLNHRLKLRRQFNHFFLRSLRKSKNEITLVTPYFVPPRTLIRRLLRASRRGVRVRLISTLKTDVPMARYFARTTYGELIKRGVEVYEYTLGVLHAKASVIDDRYFVGSTNFNHRSFFHDLEVAFLLESDEARNALRGEVNYFLAHSRRVTAEEVGARPWTERLFTRLFFFLRYWS